MKYDKNKLNIFDVEKKALTLANPVQLEIGERNNNIFLLYTLLDEF